MIIKSTIPKIVWWLQQRHKSCSDTVMAVDGSAKTAMWWGTMAGNQAANTKRAKVDKIRNYFCLHPSNISFFIRGFFSDLNRKLVNCNILGVNSTVWIWMLISLWSCGECLCISLFVKPTVEAIDVVYLISHLCWRKLKWKWHHF